MTSAFLTLTKGQGHTTTSKVTDVEVSAFSECFLLNLILKTNERRHTKVLFCFVACNQQFCNSLCFFLYLHKIVEGLYYQCSLFVCLSFCVSGSVCEQNSNIKETCQKFTYSPQLANLTTTVYSTWNQAQFGGFLDIMLANTLYFLSLTLSML